MKCNHASSGCNYPEAECAGLCMGDFETHPRGTGEVLRQLRAEREALTLQVEEQRRLLEQSLRWHQGDKWRDGNSEERAAWEAHHDAITQHLKGKE